MTPKTAILLTHGQPLRGPQSPEELDLKSYFPLAYKFAHRWTRAFDGDYDEALSAAMLGLVEARDKWQPTRGPFGAIVAFYVRGAVNGALAQHQRRKGLAIQDTRHGRKQDRSREACGKKPIRHQGQTLRRLYAKRIAADGTEVDVIDSVRDETPNAEELLIARERDDHARRLLATTPLTPREREVIDGRFLTDGEPLALHQIGTSLNISNERVRQIQCRALEKLRETIDRGDGDFRPRAAVNPVLEPQQEAPQTGENEMLKKSIRASAKANSKKAKKPGVGVVATIIATMAKPTGATKDEVLAALVKKFPDRVPEQMAATIQTQAHRQGARREKTDAGVRYFLDGRAA